MRCGTPVKDIRENLSPTRLFMDRFVTSFLFERGSPYDTPSPSLISETACKNRNLFSNARFTSFLNDIYTKNRFRKRATSEYILLRIRTPLDKLPNIRYPNDHVQNTHQPY